MVDTKSPGFSLSPIFTLGGNRTNATFYDNVRVPVSMLVGRENDGWKLITTQLNGERAPNRSPLGAREPRQGARARRSSPPPHLAPGGEHRTRESRSRRVVHRE